MSNSRSGRWALLSFLLLAGVLPLRAGVVYETRWTDGVRGSVSYGGTSYGAYTILPGYWSFQNGTGSDDFIWSMTFPMGVLDTATATTQTWTNGPGGSGFSAVFYIGQPDGLGGVSLSPLVLDSTNVLPGGVVFNITRIDATRVRYSGTIDYTGVFAATGHIIINGNVAQGVDHDSNSTSIVLTEGTLLNTARITGVGSEVPEPSTGWLAACAGGLLFTLRRRAR